MWNERLEKGLREENIRRGDFFVSPFFQEALASLGRLSAVRLDETSRRIRKSLAQVEWKMSLCLLAMVRTGGFRELGYATISEYGEKVLNLSGKKLGWLLGTARALEHLPLLSEAFKRGEIGWGKVRAIQSLATPETERRWLDFALANPTETVVKKVALSPTQWKRHRALEASLRKEPMATVEAVEEVLKTRAESASENVDGEVSKSPQGRALNQEVEKADVFQPPVEVERTSLGPQGELEGDASRDGEPVIETHRPDRIRLVVEFTPDQYALYEAAEKRVRARAGKRVARGEVLVQLAERVLAEGTARSRARHQILIHTCENCRNAWYETDQGVYPVTEEVLEKAREESSPLKVDPLPETVSPPTNSETTIRQSGPLVMKSDGEPHRESYVVSQGFRDPSNLLSPSAEAGPSSRNGRSLPPFPLGANSWSRRSTGSENSDSGGGTGSKGGPPSKSTGREHIPNATLRALFARAGNCCERCRARSAHLQVHHVVPVCEGGGNTLDQLRLYCRACHTLHHEKDFQEKPGWRWARDAATAGVEGEGGLGHL